MMFNYPLLNLVVLQVILKSKIREDVTPDDWLKLISILNLRGMLYYGFQDGKVARVAIAYRVKEITEDIDLNIPEREEGKILWIANYISFDSDKGNIKDEIKDMFKRYKDINEIAFENPDGKIIRIKRQVTDEQEKEDQNRNAKV